MKSIRKCKKFYTVCQHYSSFYVVIFFYLIFEFIYDYFNINVFGENSVQIDTKLVSAATHIFLCYTNFHFLATVQLLFFTVMNRLSILVLK